MNEEVFFFDTYAFFEIINGNPKYQKYQDVLPVTTVFNLAELNYGLKKEKGAKLADWITEKYALYLVEVKIEDIKKAMDLKTKQRKLSIPDAIGYTIAKRHGLKFLTGDEAFRDFQGVEFVNK